MRAITKYVLALLALPFFGAVSYATYQGIVTIGASVANPTYTAPVAGTGQVSISNPLPVMTGGTQTFTFSLSSNAYVPFGSSNIMDVQQNGDYSEADLYITSVGTGGVITLYGSNDQVSFPVLSAQRDDGLWVTNGVIGYAANHFIIPIKFRYLQMAVSGLTGGSFAGSITFKSKSTLFPPGAFSATPAFSQMYALGSSLNVPQPVTQPDVSQIINTSTAGTFNVAAGSSGKMVYVTDIDVMSAGTTSVFFEYGTQTTNPCDTGTTPLTGAYPLAAQAKISHGSGLGAFLSAPAGKQVCIVNSSAVQISGFVSYAIR